MATTTDPLCSMTIEDAPTAPRTTHFGHTHRFCSVACRDRFTAHPDSYLPEGQPR